MEDLPWLLAPKIRQFLLATFLLALVMSAVATCAAQQARQQLKVSIASKGKWLDLSRSPDGGNVQRDLNPEGWTGLDVVNVTDSWIHMTVKRVDSPYPLFYIVVPPKTLKRQDTQEPGIDPVGKGRLLPGDIFSAVIPAGDYTITTASAQFEPTVSTLKGTSTEGHTVFLLLSSDPNSADTHQALPGSTDADKVRSAIDRIANGSHQELPPPTQTSTAPGQNPGWTIENATGYQLHLYLSGPTERDYVIPNGNSINLDLPSGSYRIAADVSSKSVTPFYAVRQLNTDTRWKSHFYIARQ
jgi:hypothetical protein